MGQCQWHEEALKVVFCQVTETDVCRQSGDGGLRLGLTVPPSYLATWAARPHDQASYHQTSLNCWCGRVRPLRGMSVSGAA